MYSITTIRVIKMTGWSMKAYMSDILIHITSIYSITTISVIKFTGWSMKAYVSDILIHITNMYSITTINVIKLTGWSMKTYVSVLKLCSNYLMAGIVLACMTHILVITNNWPLFSDVEFTGAHVS